VEVTVGKEMNFPLAIDGTMDARVKQGSHKRATPLGANCQMDFL
jgi:hypothetical protein